MPFVEAFRQFQFRVGKENFLLMHVSLVPVTSSDKEQKTKPTQHSIRELRGLGLSPDVIICRSADPLGEKVRAAIGSFSCVLLCTVEYLRHGLCWWGKRSREMRIHFVTTPLWTPARDPGCAGVQSDLGRTNSWQWICVTHAQLPSSREPPRTPAESHRPHHHCEAPRPLSVLVQCTRASTTGPRLYPGVRLALSRHIFL